MVGDPIILESDSHGLITAHSCSNLIFAFTRQHGALLASRSGVQKPVEGFLSVT